MSKKIIITALIMIAIAALGVVSIARAQTLTPPIPNCPGGCQYDQQQFSYGIGGRGSRGSSLWQNGARAGVMDRGFFHEYMMEALAIALDMPADQLEQRLANGDNLRVILQELGLESDTINNIVVEARINAIEKAVGDGLLDQEQADWMFDRINQMQSYENEPTKGECTEVGLRGFGHHGGGMRRYSQ